MSGYTVDFFIKKFSKIPDSKWCKGSYSKGDMYCALGHCGETDSGKSTDESRALINLFLNRETQDYTSVADINDGRIRYGTIAKEYMPIVEKLKTPKARILAALRKLKGRKRSKKRKKVK